MAFNWAETRAAVRKTVAETFGLQAQYRESDMSPSLTVSVRVHSNQVEVEHEGFMRHDEEIWVWFQLSEVSAPEIDAAIHIDSTGEDYLVERVLPATDVAIPVVVRVA